MQARLTESEYERAREAFREDKLFDLFESSLDTLRQSVEGQQASNEELQRLVIEIQKHIEALAKSQAIILRRMGRKDAT